jgi:hypothetical protein
MTYQRMAELLADAPCEKITAGWLHYYQSGRAKTLDVDKVQAVYELLTKSKLDI